ncbi:hypothetical protein ACIQNG_29950 [Streptomyces sp. NPDC091377]|uniref:hypothetical protein n=1 Tax=Streptomyces sp. NPDC091377 TaxID=3365995 RepID=UPI00381E67DB
MPETAQEQTQAAAPVERWKPALHEIVIDNHSNKPGEYMGKELGVTWLRPVGGGIEWPTESFRQATQEEAIRARVAHENRRSATP